MNVKTKKFVESSSKRGASLTDILERTRTLSLKKFDDDDMEDPVAIVPNKNAHADEAGVKGEQAKKKKR